MLLRNISLLQQLGPWWTYYVSLRPGSPPPPDHIEGAHPLLGGEIRFLLFWLAPTSPGLHFTTTTCYYSPNYCTGLFSLEGVHCTTLLQLSVSLSVWLVALKPAIRWNPQVCRCPRAGGAKICSQ